MQILFGLHATDLQVRCGRIQICQTDLEVIPVSDPNASTMAQKVVQYQAALQLAQGAPDIYNLPLLHRQMLEANKEVQKIVPLEEDFKPMDPVGENMAMLKNNQSKIPISGP